MSRPNLPVRIGFGVDIHPLKVGRPMIIGGVQIPCDFGPDGHSDADVLIHAICDALLGSLNLRDIGFHFPDTDPKYKNADSAIFLGGVRDLIKRRGYSIGNIDSTVLIESPKLNLHIPAMCEKMARILEILPEQISVKATRGEKMGPVGEGKAVQAYASVLVVKG